jgi:hypothetical protein
MYEQNRDLRGGPQVSVQIDVFDQPPAAGEPGSTLGTVASSVGVWVGSSVGATVGSGVAVSVGVSVSTGVAVAVSVETAVAVSAGTVVAVGVAVAVLVGVFVGVFVAVGLGADAVRTPPETLRVVIFSVSYLLLTLMVANPDFIQVGAMIEISAAPLELVMLVPTLTHVLLRSQ